MTTADLKEITPDLTVDAKGTLCPEPILRAKKAIDEIVSGQIMEILSNDTSTKTDLPAWCERMGHEFLGFRLDHSDGVFYRVYLKKG